VRRLRLEKDLLIMCHSGNDNFIPMFLTVKISSVIAEFHIFLHFVAAKQLPYKPLLLLFILFVFQRGYYLYYIDKVVSYIDIL